MEPLTHRVGSCRWVMTNMSGAKSRFLHATENEHKEAHMDMLEWIWGKGINNDLETNSIDK